MAAQALVQFQLLTPHSPFVQVHPEKEPAPPCHPRGQRLLLLLLLVPEARPGGLPALSPGTGGQLAGRMQVCIAKEKMQDELKKEDKPEWCQLTSQSQHFYGDGRTPRLMERKAVALRARLVLRF